MNKENTESRSVFTLRMQYYMQKINQLIHKALYKLNSNPKAREIITSKQGQILLAGISILIILLVFTLLLGNQNAENKTQATKRINALKTQAAEVNSVYTDIQQLTKSVSQNASLTQAELAHLNQRLQVLQERIQQLSNQKDINQLSQSLNQSNQLLSQKVTDLQNNINEVKDVLQPHTFIDASKLPFKVISVDIWGGIPYATVEIDHQQDLIGINETRAGWTVDSIDFASREIVFRNDKDQYIKIQCEN